MSIIYKVSFIGTERTCNLEHRGEIPITDYHTVHTLGGPQSLAVTDT